MSVNKRLAFSWILIMFFFVSCISTNSKTQPAHTYTSTPEIAPFATLTEPLTPILPSATVIVLPTIPTYPPEAAYTLLFDTLHAGATCKLPCWLNMIPGTSSHGDAYREWGTFLKLAGTTKILPRDYLYIFDQIKNNDEISILTHYYLLPNSEIIGSMHINTQALRDIGNGTKEDAYASLAYKDILKEYLLPNILSTYGPPDEILFDMKIVAGEPTSPDFFNIWLFYPTRGAILEYTGSANVRNGIIHSCPSEAFVSLWLVSPENTELYQNTIEEATGLPSSPFYKSAEDAIGMTNEQFYNVFKNPTGQCVDSPLNVWPEH